MKSEAASLFTHTATGTANATDLYMTPMPTKKKQKKMTIQALFMYKIMNGLLDLMPAMNSKALYRVQDNEWPFGSHASNEQQGRLHVQHNEWPFGSHANTEQQGPLVHKIVYGLLDLMPTLKSKALFMHKIMSGLLDLMPALNSKNLFMHKIMSGLQDLIPAITSKALSMYKIVSCLLDLRPTMGKLRITLTNAPPVTLPTNDLMVPPVDLW